MFATYAHLTGNDVDREINKLYGISSDELEATTNRLEPRICPHCNEGNSPISKHCHLCGESLDGATVHDDDELQPFMLKHVDEFKAFFDRMTEKSAFIQS